MHETTRELARMYFNRQPHNTASEIKKALKITSELTNCSVKDLMEFLGIDINHASDKEYYKQEVKRLHSKGLTDVDISEKLSLCTATVRRYRNILKLPPNFGTIERKEATIRSLYNQGLTIDEIGIKVGCSPSSITRIVRKNGWTREKPTKKGTNYDKA